jgi:hypothetical protein
VRHRPTEKPRHRRAVEADDTAAGPLGELRVGACLEGERAEEALGRLERSREVEVSGQGLTKTARRWARSPPLLQCSMTV